MFSPNLIEAPADNIKLPNPDILLPAKFNVPLTIYFLLELIEKSAVIVTVCPETINILLVIEGA